MTTVDCRNLGIAGSDCPDRGLSNPRVRFELSGARAPISPPQGRPLIVHIVVNIEHWPFDKPMPRSLIAKPHGQSRGPDIANFCWVEYGLRAGIPRLITVLGERGLPATAAINASIIDVYPSCAAAVAQAGWEFIGHGMVQRSLEHEDDEVAVIAASLDKLRRFSGRPVRGWLGPGFGETLATPDYLAAAGIEFIFEWCLDDLPTWMRTRHGPVLAMPYALELNDVTIFALEKHSSAEYFQRFRDTVATFEPELARQPRVLTLALHPHIIAQPHRLPYFIRTLDMLQKRSDTIFMTASEIGDWFIANDKSEGRHAADSQVGQK